MWTSQATVWRCQWVAGTVTMASWPQRRSWAGRSWPSSSWSSPSMPMSCSMATLLFCATQTELWLFNACFHMFWTTGCIKYRRKLPSSSSYYIVLCPNWVFFFRACGDFVPLVCSQQYFQASWQKVKSPDGGRPSHLPSSIEILVLMLALPLISLAVFLVVLACVILSLLCRPSAKRTVTVRGCSCKYQITRMISLQCV